MQALCGKLKDGTLISQTILTNDNGMEVRFISYGAAITDIIVPDRDGRELSGFAAHTKFSGTKV